MGFVFVDVAGIVVCGLGYRRVGLPGDGHGGVFTTPAFKPDVAPVIVFIPIRFGQFVACHAERRHLERYGFTYARSRIGSFDTVVSIEDFQIV